jgi:hypothetical protein
MDVIINCKFKFFIFQTFYVLACSCTYPIERRNDMAKGKGGGSKPAKGRNDDRTNGKAFKKAPKFFDAIKRKLVKKSA